MLVNADDQGGAQNCGKGPKIPAILISGIDPAGAYFAGQASTVPFALLYRLPASWKIGEYMEITSPPNGNPEENQHKRLNHAALRFSA
ncbi:MAG: hypothetical protein R2860_09970 [Desulfobacterales bacterium]